MTPKNTNKAVEFIKDTFIFPLHDYFKLSLCYLLNTSIISFYLRDLKFLPLYNKTYSGKVVARFICAQRYTKDASLQNRILVKIKRQDDITCCDAWRIVPF